MTRGRLAVAAIVVVALIAVGWFEGARFEDEQNDGIESVLRAVGPIDQPALSHFRFQVGLSCLVYERDGNPLALELCWDMAGRLVEAVDRRGGDERRWTLRPNPDAAEHRADIERVRRLARGLYEDARAEALRRLAASRS
jgi:hypothetical protein